MTTCGEVMTVNPTCCVPNDSVEHAAQVMRGENIDGPLPVIESRNSKKLVGIITDRDMVIKVLAAGRNGQTTSIESVMTRNPVTCYDRDNVDDALQAMSDHQVRRIPIVNDNNEIVGIIAQADIATRIDEPNKTARVVEDISKPDTEPVL